MLNALALNALFKMMINAFCKSPQRHWLRRIISLSAFAGLVGLSAYTAPRFYAHFRASLPGSADNWIEQEAVRYIRQHTQPDETIFVWGFFPELYVLADRRPASRYVYTNVLTGFIPWEHMEPEYDTSATIVPGTWDILMSELRANRPRLIIDTSPGQYRGYGKYPPQKFPLLAEFLEQDYEIAHDVAAGPNLVALRIFQLRSVE